MVEYNSHQRLNRWEYKRAITSGFLMKKIKIILAYRQLFDDPHLPIEEYLKGINKGVLIYYARYYCNLSVQHLNSTSSNIFWAFLNTEDKGTDYYNYLTDRVNKLISIDNNKTEFTVLNIRTSLKFFELIQSFDDHDCNEIPDLEVRKRLLKVYLLLNNEVEITPRENINVKDITIIDMDTLIIYQRLFSQPKYNLRLLIDEYWSNYYKIDRKRNYMTPEEVLEDFPQKYQSFKHFLDSKSADVNYFTKKIDQYLSKINF